MVVSVLVCNKACNGGGKDSYQRKKFIVEGMGKGQC